jgi:hypothetical protein
VVTLQGNGAGDPGGAAEQLLALLKRECGGRHALTLLDASRPQCELPEPVADRLDAVR